MTAIARGFPDSVRDAQAVFRAVMNAMARPGTVQALPGVTAPAPLSPAAAAVGLALLQGREHVTLEARAIGRRLPQRIAQRRKPRLAVIAAEHMAKADLAGREPHRAARDRGLAQIERGSVATDAAAHHDEPAFRRPDLLGVGHVRQLRDKSGELLASGASHDRHGGAAGRDVRRGGGIRSGVGQQVFHGQVVYATRQLIASGG